MSSPSRNIEIKARIADRARVGAIAKGLATAYLGIERQRDTYFSCVQGRLKLREIEGRTAQLIAYRRADRPDAKPSDYRLIEIADAGPLRELLFAALGIVIVVEKVREIFLYQNVRIHLDEVAGLGSFLEFEAVVTKAIDDREAAAQIRWLEQQFQIAPNELISSSYSDMLLGRAP
jgi:adenylate cyclase class 2